MTKMFFSEIIS